MEKSEIIKKNWGLAWVVLAQFFENEKKMR
jgi:hypothetical protein